MPCPAPGLYQDVPYEEYASWEAINSGAVAQMMLSPKHGRSALTRDAVQSDSDAMRFGRGLHSYILEPREFASGKIEISTECKAELRSGENKGKPCGAPGIVKGKDCLWYCGRHKPQEFSSPSEYLTEREFSHIQKIRESVQASVAAPQLRNGWTEVSMVFPYKGRFMKGRLDFLSYDYSRIVDLKKIQAGKGTRDDCQKRVFSYGYYRQSAIYQTGIQILKGILPHFVWVFAEDNVPYDINALVADEYDYEIGWKHASDAIDRYAACEGRGVFDGYLTSLDVELGALPLWVKQQFLREQHSEQQVGNAPAEPAGVAGGDRGPSGDVDPTNEWERFQRDREVDSGEDGDYVF